jgi:hypothetical protein
MKLEVSPLQLAEWLIHGIAVIIALLQVDSVNDRTRWSDTMGIEDIGAVKQGSRAHRYFLSDRFRRRIGVLPPPSAILLKSGSVRDLITYLLAGLTLPDWATCSIRWREPGLQSRPIRVTIRSGNSEREDL